MEYKTELDLQSDKVKPCTGDGFVSLCRINLVGTRTLNSDLLIFPGCWHFENGASSFIDNVPLNHGGLPYVVHLVVHLEFFVLGKSRGSF